MKTIKKWAGALCVIASVWLGMRVLGCVAAAHAQDAAGTLTPPAATPGDVNVTPWLVGIMIALQVADMVLARIAPLTKTTWDDHVSATLHEILTHVKTKETL